MKKAQAIDAFGSQLFLARAIGVTSETVRLWPDELPAHRAAQIREAINAKIARLQEMVK